jgi:thioredoxin 1
MLFLIWAAHKKLKLPARETSQRWFCTKGICMKKFLMLVCTAVVMLAACNDGELSKKVADNPHPSSSKARVTFIELGSVNCIPCRAMQPVMRDLEKKFGNQIRIEFYDILQDEASARKYGIRVMPTQVFLDQDGREFHRHEGFYPFAEIESLLLDHGLKQ